MTKLLLESTVIYFYVPLSPSMPVKTSYSQVIKDNYCSHFCTN